jgi:adenosylcobinamide-phosphate synthase
MGRYIGYAQSLRCGPPSHSGDITAGPAHKPAFDLFYGTGIVLSGMGLAAAAGATLAWLCTRLPALPGLLLEAAALKTTFSLRGLDRAAGEVQSALENGDLPGARTALAWHLVSRETSALDEALVAAAAVESVAENTSDGVVAPLFYYAVGGLPAALAYRFANTADAMLGYHSPALEWLGKVPARLDDLLNLLPARLTGILIALATPLTGGSSRGALQGMCRDAHQTQSPNAGYPMSAMAGALGVELEKSGHYRLSAGGRAATAADIQRARRTLLATALLFAAATAGLAGILHRERGRTPDQIKTA